MPLQGLEGGLGFHIPGSLCWGLGGSFWKAQPWGLEQGLQKCPGWVGQRKQPLGFAGELGVGGPGTGGFHPQGICTTSLLLLHRARQRSQGFTCVSSASSGQPCKQSCDHP